MSKIQNQLVTVWGDMTADRAADQYPTVTLCPDCLSGHEVVSKEGESQDDCDDCGAESLVGLDNVSVTFPADNSTDVFCPKCLSDQADFDPKSAEESEENCSECGAES